MNILARVHRFELAAVIENENQHLLTNRNGECNTPGHAHQILHVGSGQHVVLHVGVLVQQRVEQKCHLVRPLLLTQRRVQAVEVDLKRVRLRR